MRSLMLILTNKIMEKVKLCVRVWNDIVGIYDSQLSRVFKRMIIETKLEKKTP